MFIFKRYLLRIILSICILLPIFCLGQIKKYSFAEIDSLQKIEKRSMIVFVHTDWCKYCAAMNSTTFKNEDIIKKVNEDFYFIELNAEEKKNITFNGYTFKFKQTGSNTGMHELAEQLGTRENEITFPTLCFLNEQYEIIYQLKNYVKAKDLSVILNLL